MHKVVLLGRLGGDPETRFTPSGVQVTNFSVATSARISKESNPDCPDGWKESYSGKAWELTTWFRVSCWRGLADVADKYLKKGREVYIEGEVHGMAVNGSQNPRVWTGNDGVPRASYEVTARTLQLIGGRDGNGGGHTPQDEDEPPGYQEPGEIPF